MSILVTSGTGTVGSRVVKRLAAAGERVRVLTRNPEKAASLPPGAQAVLGDLSRPRTLGPALTGIKALCLITPLSPDEARDGIALVQTAAAAGVELIVLLSVFRVESGAHIPHFRSKVDIEAAIRATRIPHIVIMPGNFFQNDFWYREAILKHGIYPQPLGAAGVSRVDVDDIADAMFTALTQPGHAGRRYPLAGDAAYTGAETARIWSEAVGRPVAYAGDDLDRWAVQARDGMPEWLVDDLCTMYGFFQRTGLAVTGEDLQEQQKILGRPPKTFRGFVSATTRQWKEENS